MLKIGQRVLVIKKVNTLGRSKDGIRWATTAMDRYAGKMAKITARRPTRGEPKYRFDYRIDIDKGGYQWSLDWLKIVDNYKFPKYIAITPAEAVGCASIEDLKDTMAVRLSEFEDKLIIGYKLVPVYKVKKEDKEIQFEKQ